MKVEERDSGQRTQAHNKVYACMHACLSRCMHAFGACKCSDELLQIPKARVHTHHSRFAVLLRFSASLLLRRTYQHHNSLPRAHLYVHAQSHLRRRSNRDTQILCRSVLTYARCSTSVPVLCRSFLSAAANFVSCASTCRFTALHARLPVKKSDTVQVNSNAYTSFS